MNKVQIFRLAAFIYGDDNDHLSKDEIYKRIIETVVYENGNKQISIHQIIDLIEKMYSFKFSEDEINVILKDGINFLCDKSNSEIVVCLSEDVITRIRSIEKSKNLDAIIQKFSKYKNCDEISTKQVIYKFLYNLFQNNIFKYLKLVELNCNIDIASDEHLDMNDDEIEIVNSFLNWDNDEKNIAIFNIVNYSIEYCIISHRDQTSEMYFDALKNKIFYLDTNIIFRAIGIHGPNYKKRIKTFLIKCKETNQKLLISKNTEDEFLRTIESQIRNINKYHKKKINPELFSQLSDHDDVYYLYYEWKKSKPNSKIYLFRAFVHAQYKEFLKEYEIEIDDKHIIDEEDEKTSKLLSAYTEGICSIKGHYLNENEIDRSAKHDATNILICENRRQNNNKHLKDTTFFLTSTDKILRSWDNQRNNHLPIVLHPSEWLSLILRYISRSDDDFKSFVSFLNLNKHNMTDNIQYDSILVGISEITESFEQQELIIQSIIDIKFKDIFSTNKPRKIAEKAKKYAEKFLEDEIKVVRDENHKLKNNLEEINKHLRIKKSQKNNLKSKIDRVLSEIDKNENVRGKLDDRLQLLESDNTKYKEILKEQYINEEVRKWGLKAKWCIPVIIVIFVFYLFQNILNDYNYNFASKFINWISNLDEVRKGFWIGINWIVFAVLEFNLIKYSYNRLFNKSKIDIFTEKIKIPEDLV